jgi:hypothetical protein
MLFYPRPLQVGTQAEWRFTLNSGSRTECVAYGEVRHYSVRQTSHVVGVEFTHFMPETVESIRRYIEQRSAATA